MIYNNFTVISHRSHHVSVSLESFHPITTPGENMTLTCRVQGQSINQLEEKDLNWIKSSTNHQTQFISKNGLIQGVFHSLGRYHVETIPIGSGLAIISILNIIGLLET